MKKSHHWVPVLRIIARGWSLLSIAFLLLIFLGEAFSGSWIWPTGNEWVGLTFFPVGVFIGLVLGWLREEAGGILVVLSLAGFSVWNLVASGGFAGGPFFVLVAAPGFLFLITWWLSRPHTTA